METLPAGEIKRHRKVQFAKMNRGAWHSMKYVSRYLKHSPVSAPRLRHYGGGAVGRHYFVHRTGKHKRQMLSQEDITCEQVVCHYTATSAMSASGPDPAACRALCDRSCRAAGG